MVSAFIENVFVHDGGRIVVRFKYEQSIENIIMMVPFTSMVIWTFQEKVGNSWKKILWQSGKI